MFRILRAIKAHLAALAKDFDPDTLTVAQAADAITLLAAIEKAAAGLRLVLSRRVDNKSLFGQTGERSAAEWLARQTGQSTSDAQRDLECSKRLRELPDAADAVRNGEFSSDQAKSLADGAAADPSAERELLDTARRGSLGELNRKAKARKAAALGDDEARARAAQKNRSFVGGTNELGAGWGRFNGPAHLTAQLNAQIKPFIELAFAKARREGRRERADALAFDAFMAYAGLLDLDLDPPAAAGTDLTPTGGNDDPDTTAGTPCSAPAGPTPPTPPSATPTPAPRAPIRADARIIMRVDLPALKRGHTVGGELCDIHGYGPVPLADLKALLPDAAIDIVLTNGRDVFNVTHLGRHTTARQQVVLDLLNIGCTRQGCPATQHLQIDHRIDWHKIRITELANLDWLCPHDHRLKTHHGWQLEPGTGKRPLRPPGQQPWLDADPPAPAAGDGESGADNGPPRHAA